MKTKVLILGLICLLMLGAVLSAEKEDIINYNWQELFTEPCERIYIIMKDNEVFDSSNQDRSVSIDARRLEKVLKNIKGKNYSIKDIAIVIHNHRFKRKFSNADWRFHRDLKKLGFNGLFLMYCHMTKKTYNIEDKKKGLT